MVDPITLEVIQERLISIVREMRATGSADFPTLSVALESVRRLVER